MKKVLGLVILSFNFACLYLVSSDSDKKQMMSNSSSKKWFDHPTQCPCFDFVATQDGHLPKREWSKAKQMFDAVLETGIHPDNICCGRPESGHSFVGTPLRHAIEENDEEYIKLLVGRGANPNNSGWKEGECITPSSLKNATFSVASLLYVAGLRPNLFDGDFARGTGVNANAALACIAYKGASKETDLVDWESIRIKASPLIYNLIRALEKEDPDLMNRYAEVMRVLLLPGGMLNDKIEARIGRNEWKQYQLEELIDEMSKHTQNERQLTFLCRAKTVILAAKLEASEHQKRRTAMILSQNVLLPPLVSMVTEYDNHHDTMITEFIERIKK